MFDPVNCGDNTMYNEYRGSRVERFLVMLVRWRTAHHALTHIFSLKSREIWPQNGLISGDTTSKICVTQIQGLQALNHHS
jgi:hypothetical protein